VARQLLEPDRSDDDELGSHPDLVLDACHVLTEDSHAYQLNAGEKHDEDDERRIE
jgi:hypothetical protein